MTKASAIARPGEPSQAEKESMSLGAIVGRNDIAKPWYTKSTMPTEIKTALSHNKPTTLVAAAVVAVQTMRSESTTKHNKAKDIEEQQSEKMSKSERKLQKKERKRDMKRQLKELKR